MAIGILVSLALANEAGRFVGVHTRRRRGTDPIDVGAVGSVTGGLLTLFAFVLGIALSMASTRLEARRDSVLNEANAIGTVWLRAGLTAGPEGPEIRRILREYTQVRIAQVTEGPDDRDDASMTARTNALQRDMWLRVEALTQRDRGPIEALLVASMNDMIDLSLTNRRNFASHVPAIIARLLLAVSLLTVASIGYHFGLIGERHPIVVVVLLLVWTVAIVLVLDIDDTRDGQVRVSPAPLVWTAQGFGPDP